MLWEGTEHECVVACERDTEYVQVYEREKESVCARACVNLYCPRNCNMYYEMGWTAKVDDMCVSRERMCGITHALVQHEWGVQQRYAGRGRLQAMESSGRERDQGVQGQSDYQTHYLDSQPLSLSLSSWHIHIALLTCIMNCGQLEL